MVWVICVTTVCPSQPAEGVALVTSTPWGRSSRLLYTSLELRMSLLADCKLAVEADRGRGLIGEVSGDESAFAT